MDVLPDLVGLSDYVFGRTSGRLVGLTDDEYLWEPVADCWNVRLCADDVWRVDWAPMPDTPTPFTTIAWRLGHLRQNYGQSRNAMMLGAPSARGRFDWSDSRAPATAEEAVAELTAAHDAWRALLTSLSDEHLAQPIGDVGGQYATYTRASFVHHELDEVIHHAAEIGALRDLYAASRGAHGGPTTVAAAAANGRWASVEAMLGTGAAVDGWHGGGTALHHAAGAGRLDIVRLLLDAGADTALEDERFHATPLGWAEFFHQPPVIAYLTEVSS